MVLLVVASAASARENPIRKVVTLLQGLRTEVEEEGAEEQKLFDKFQCYCKHNKEGLQNSLDQARSEIGEFEATLKELSGSNAQLDLEIEEIKKESAEAQTTVDDASGVRTKEHEEYLAESAEITNSISALDKAIPTIKKGLAPAEALAQVGLGASMLLSNVRSVDDHLALEALLQSQSGVGSGAPGTEQVLGILEQMRDNFKEDLASTTKAEEETQATFESLKAAKSKQVETLQAELREKEERVSSQAAELAATKENHEDTSAAFAADEQFFADLQANCGTKGQEFDANTRARAMEIEAIGQAIKILNDDSSLDLFKKTMPGPAFVEVSFVQVRSSGSKAAVAQRAIEASQSAGDFPGLALVQVAMRKAAASDDKDKFGPVKKMIADMIASMQQQDADDGQQKDFCNQAIPESDHAKTDLEQQIADGARLMEELKTEIKTLAERIQVAEVAIKDLDDSTTEATEQRKEENALHTKNMAENAMAIQLIQKAKAKLSDVYQPAEESLVDVSQSGLQVEDQSEERGPTEDQMGAMLGLSFLQRGPAAMLSESIKQLSGGKADPGDAPETAQYSKKTGQGMGIMALMDELISDLKLGSQKATSDEQSSQSEYEKGLTASQDARKATSREIVAMQEQKADAGEKVHEAKATHGEHSDEHSSIVAKLAALHAECDFLLANFDVRAKARALEIEAMRSSAGILSGADFSLRQGLRARGA